MLRAAPECAGVEALAMSCCLPLQERLSGGDCLYGYFWMFGIILMAVALEFQPNLKSVNGSSLPVTADQQLLHISQ